MPFLPIPTPLYANLPLSPGIPLLLRAPGAAAFIAPVLMLADALGITALLFGPQWGIFDQNGNQVAIPDSVYAVDYRREFQVATYPLEQGAFLPYNRVEQPREARVRMAVNTDRAGFLEALENAVASRNLYALYTPDAVYERVNITHFDYRRDPRAGAYLLQVDVWVMQIRLLNVGQFASSAAPSVRPVASSGVVQPTSPPASAGVLLPGMPS